MDARILDGCGEWYAEAMACLQSNLTCGLDETGCPWLTPEECCTQSIRMVLDQTTVGERMRQQVEGYRLASAEMYPQSFGLFCDY